MHTPETPNDNQTEQKVSQIDWDRVLSYFPVLLLIRLQRAGILEQADRVNLWGVLTPEFTKFVSILALLDAIQMETSSALKAEGSDFPLWIFPLIFYVAVAILQQVFANKIREEQA